MSTIPKLMPKTPKTLTGNLLRISKALALAGCLTALLLLSGGDHRPALAAESPAAKQRIDSMISVTRELYSKIDLYEPNSALILRTPAPAGYTRIPDSALSSFGLWFRYFPMRPASEPLTTPAGQFVATQAMISGVLDAPIVSQRSTSRGVLYFLLGLYAHHTENELEYLVRTTGTDTLMMSRFLTGVYSLNSNKTKLIWKEGRQRSLDLSTVSRYTELAINITNFRTLIRDCREVSPAEVRPGDLYIALDTTSRVDDGHLAVVLDIAEPDQDAKPVLNNIDGTPAERLFLFGNSLTPATSFHVIRPLKSGKGAWFTGGEIAEKLQGFPAGRFFRLPYRFLE